MKTNYQMNELWVETTLGVISNFIKTVSRMILPLPSVNKGFRLRRVFLPNIVVYLKVISLGIKGRIIIAKVNGLRAYFIT
jgi:hypothetical protein